jgi:hypothetical protein
MEFGTFFNFPLRILKCIGIELLEDGSGLKTKKQKIKSIAKKCAFWFLVTADIMFVTLAGLSGYKDFKNKNISSDNLTTCVFLSCSVCRIVVIWFKRSAIAKVMGEMTTEFHNVKDDVEANKMTKQAFKNFDRYQKAFIYFSMFAELSLALSPLIQRLTAGFWDMKLPHPLWLPYDVSSNVFNYAVTFITIEIYATIQSFESLSNELIPNSIITVLSLEFEILAKDLEKVDDKTEFKDIKKLVERHENLLDISEQVKNIFSISNMITFIGSSILLCLPAFLALSSHESFLILKFSSCFIFLALQTGAVCFYGDKLRTSSLKVSENITLCDWYKVKDKKVLKALQLILLRSQNPVQMTALKFVNISIETFTRILSTAYSYLSLLLVIFK